MSREDVATLAFKLLAIFLVFQSLGSLAFTSIFFRSQLYGLYLISYLIPLILGLVLWKLAQTLGQRTFGKSSEVESLIGADLQRFTPVLISLIGLWLLARAIPDISMFIANRISWALGSQRLEAARWQAIPAMAQVLVGGWLLLRPRHLAKLVTLRASDEKPPSEPAHN